MLFYIIDGHNFIHAFRDKFSDDMNIACENLSDMIAFRHPEGSSKNRILIVYDGQPGVYKKTAYKTAVKYTSGQDADWLIKKIVISNPNPRNIIVVSDDKTLVRHVGEYGAAHMSTAKFGSKLFSFKSKKPIFSSEKKLSPEEIEDINNEILRKKGLL